MLSMNNESDRCVNSVVNKSPSFLEFASGNASLRRALLLPQSVIEARQRSITHGSLRISPGDWETQL